MSDKPLHSNIKNAVVLFVGDHKTEFHSGCKIIDVTFPNVIHPEVGEIRFKNYYVGVLSIRAKFRSTENNGEPGELKWRTCVRRMKLMANPHTESGAQDFFSISSKQFLFDLANLMGLRFILQQPSPVWKDFKLEELKVFRTSTVPRSVPLPGWLTEEPSEKHEKLPSSPQPLTPARVIGRGSERSSPQPLTPARVIGRGSERSSPQPLTPARVIGRGSERGVPDLESLSANLQELWALAEEVSANQTTVNLGRFEVDGCYDINLLSYT